MSAAYPDENTAQTAINAPLAIFKRPAYPPAVARRRMGDALSGIRCMKNPSEIALFDANKINAFGHAIGFCLSYGQYQADSKLWHQFS